MKYIALLFTLLLFSTVFASTKVYKYQDESGKWVFTDTKPVNEKPEEIQFKDGEKKKKQPRVYSTKRDGRYAVVVKNPFYAPIQVKVTPDNNGKAIMGVVGANEQKIIGDLGQTNQRFRYRWVLGEPDVPAGLQAYTAPVGSLGKFRISQGFKGKFSHSKEPSLYAIDIAMPLGSYIAAAREGTVIATKDDYHMGGRDSFFLDKANYVMILHSDGTYATYAHILMGSVMVSPGDVVERGQNIARSGTSGYSTGPHLHFVVRRNSGFNTVSVPFLMQYQDGRSIRIKRGVEIEIAASR